MSTCTCPEGACRYMRSRMSEPTTRAIQGFRANCSLGTSNETRLEFNRVEAVYEDVESRLNESAGLIHDVYSKLQASRARRGRSRKQTGPRPRRMSVGRAHSAKGAVFPHLQGNNGIMAGIGDSAPPKVSLSEEFESPQVLGMNWWAIVSYTANFSLGGLDIRRSQSDGLHQPSLPQVPI